METSSYPNRLQVLGALLQVADRRGIRVETSPSPPVKTRVIGLYRPRTKTLPPRVWVSSKLSTRDGVEILAHEIAHDVLHRFGEGRRFAEVAPMKRSQRSRVEELLADRVARLTTDALGFPGPRWNRRYRLFGFTPEQAAEIRELIEERAQLAALRLLADAPY